MLEEILAEAKDGSEYIEEQVFEKEALQEFDASKIGCKAEGNSFHASHIRDCTFSSCNFRYSGFTKNVWERVKLDGCNFSDTALSELKLKTPVFSDTDFSHADFFKTSLKGIDLSDCVIDGISVSDTLHELKGSKMTAEQAVTVAGILGIKIK